MATTRRVTIPYESLDPLTMAARRHRNSPRAVLTAFRAMEAGELTEQLIAEAGRKVERVGHLR